MKATDLMIGDWVIEKGRVCRVSFNTTIEEVRQEDCATSASSSTRYYDIEPIPLTPEILEKNADDVYKRCENGYSLFGIGEYPNNIEVTIYPKGGVEWTINGNEYAIADLMYVHQLQHALKLCGIEKEIKL